MNAPLLVASTDDARRLVVMTFEGTVVDAADVEPLRMVLPVMPVDHSLIVDLSHVAAVTPAAVEALRGVAVDAAADGETVVVVCADLERRMALVVADLDTVAPVVASVDQAIPLTRAA
jgi:hypothetical protein